MKKSLLALAIAATAASSVNAAQIVKTETGSIDFYGQLRQYVYSGDNEKNFSLKSSSSRAGFDMAYHLTPETDFVGKFEFNINDSDAFTNRKHYVGVANADYGTLLVGKNSIITDDVWGVENSYNNGGNSVLPESVGGIYWLQQAMLKYSLETDDWWVQAAYSHDNDNSNVQLSEVFAGTTIGDISIYGGGGYADNSTGLLTGDVNSDGDKVTTAKGTTVKHAMVTASYENDMYGAGVTYWYADVASSGSSKDSHSLALAGHYNLNEKSTLYGTYEFITDYASEGEDYAMLNIGADYRFSSAFRVFGEVAFEDDDSTDKQNIYTLGARFYW